VASLHSPQPHFPLIQSLCLGAGAAVFACILGASGILPHPLPLRSGLQLAALLPLTCGLAWIALSVASLRWRSILQGAALAQLAGASALTLLLEEQFHCEVPAVAFLSVWAVGEGLRLWRPFSFSSAPALEEADAKEAVAEIPHRAECSVLHCELLNHSQLVRLLRPEEASHFINRFLSICNETASARYGRTDRADSEAFRALFLPHPEGEPHSKAALQAALAIQARLKTLSAECEVRFGQELDARIGVSSGELLVARFGLPGALQHGAAGEPAEWARRLAGANLLYGSNILISEYTAELAGRTVETRPIDLLQRELPPQGPEEVFELLALAGALDAESSTRFTHYRRGVAHLRNRNWKAARNALRAARPIGRADDAIDILLHRIDEQEALAAYSQAQSPGRPTE
jgi:class 3 adenylate cyclase